MASRKSFTQLKIYTLIYEVENENFWDGFQPHWPIGAQGLAERVQWNSDCEREICSVISSH